MEIKYRGWDKTTGKMLHGFPRVCLYNLHDDDGYLVGEIDSFKDRIILMQYTGLKDKNGVEIYELNEINNIYRVIYQAPAYVLQNISNGDIIPLEVGKSDEYEITGEYSPIP